MARARVSLENVDTGTKQQTETNAEGNHQFLEVRVSRYRILAEAVGFKKLETPIFRVYVGSRQRVDAPTLVQAWRRPSFLCRCARAPGPIAMQDCWW
jgi:hypothetical protein